MMLQVHRKSRSGRKEKYNETAARPGTASWPVPGVLFFISAGGYKTYGGEAVFWKSDPLQIEIAEIPGMTYSYLYLVQMPG